MGTPCSARGSMKDARTPVCENGNGPSSLKQIHGASHFALPGAWLAGQTIESSSSVRLIDVKDAATANCGGRASEGRRQMTKLPGSCRNLKPMGDLLIRLHLKAAELRSARMGRRPVPNGHSRSYVCYALPTAFFTAAFASSRVESRVGNEEASGVTSSGISVHPRTTASQPWAASARITS